MSSTVRDRLAGQLLDGRYQVEARIARGGMADVYLALDTRLDRTVAVKIMHPGLATDDAFVSRFIREAKATARLSDPHVVAVFDQGTQRLAGGEVVFLVMEYVDGRTLRDLLRQRGRLSPGEAVAVLRPVLAALGAAHRAGIVHRDIKPENVLLADDGRVKVADFGLSRVVTDGSGSEASYGLLLGTVSYLSPEQVERGTADARSDVYAVGILLYELLTGRKPYEGTSPLQVAYRHVHDRVPPPSAAVPGLSPAIDDLVRRATDPNPSARPADAAVMLAELAAVRRSLSAGPRSSRGHASAGEVEDTAVMSKPAPDATAADPADGDHPIAVPVGALPRGARLTGQIRAYLPHGLPPVAARRAADLWRRRPPVSVLASLLVLAVLGGTGWYLTAGPGRQVSTPALLGLTRAEAEAAGARAGVAVRFAPARFSEDVPTGRVLRTDPPPRARIRASGTITVVLSRGAERYAVPALMGTSRAAAETMLSSTHLSLGDVDGRYDRQVPFGRVISTSPSPGTLLRPDTPVDLLVSKGREPIEMIDFTGRSGTEARRVLTARGFTVTIERRHDDDVAEGLVITQEVSAGPHFRGDTVVVVVSQGPPLVAVPDVVDRTVEEARRTLEDAGFAVRARGTRILDRVWTQSPRRGTAPRGSTVTLTTI